MDETLKFKFTMDRFGFSAELDTFSPTYAKDAEAALISLRETIERLFGDVERAFGLLADAGLLPRYPDWGSVDRMRRFISDFNRGTMVLPGGTLWNDNEGRRTLFNVRDYLKKIEEWAPVFKLGIWASLIASVGSVETSPLARRRCGLRTLRQVYQFDLADLTQEILPRLTELTLAVDPRTGLKEVKSESVPAVAERWTAENPAWPDLFAKSAELMSGSVPAFSEKPALLVSWLAQLDSVFKDLLELPSAAIGTSGAWFQVELDYWDQWTWSNDAPPKRGPKRQRVTVLDLLFTACHGGIPFVPSTGSNLSVAQWSRILSEALRRDAIPPQNVKDSAASNLNVAELRSLKRTGGRLELKEPIIAICPTSVQSRASAWQPQPGLRAVALGSPDVLLADARAEKEIMGREEMDLSDPLAGVLRDQTWWASLVQFVELDDEGDLPDGVKAPTKIARPSISLFYFGFGRAGEYPFLAGLRGVSDLLKSARERYSDRLPSDLQERSFWARVNFVWRRVWYWLLRLMRRPFFGRSGGNGSALSG